MAGRMIYQRVKQILAVIYNLAQHVLTKIKQKVNSQTTLWFLFSENVNQWHNRAVKAALLCISTHVTSRFKADVIAKGREGLKE